MEGLKPVAATSEVIAAARHMVELGYNIVAVRADKRPWGKDWRRHHRLDEILALLNGPNCPAIGFLGGELNNYVVALDFDNFKGEAWFRESCKAVDLDPYGWPTVITPGKIKSDGTRFPGRHRNMLDDRGLLGNSAGSLALVGIDVRGKGHTMLPPSPHPDGGNYIWLAGHEFSDFPNGIPPVPDFVYQAIAETPEQAIARAVQAQNPDNGQYRAGYIEPPIYASAPIPPPRANGPEPAAMPPQWAAEAERRRIEAWLRGALAGERDRLAAVLPGSGPGQGRNNHLNIAALKLGHWAHYGVFGEGEARSALMAAMTDNGYIKDNGAKAAHETFGQGWKKGISEPRELELADRPMDDPGRASTGRQDEHTAKSADYSGEDAKQSEPGADHFNDLDLVIKEFPPLQWVIVGWLPTGLALLVGAPKIGKSWLAMDLATEVAAGRAVFGTIATHQCGVLYIALEDPPRRLQSRMNKMLAGHEPSGNIEFYTKWPALDGGGLEKLAAHLNAFPLCRLIIIDTFAKVRGKPDGKSGVYQQDYQDIGRLQAFANEHAIALVLVHHTRKQDATDALDTISGSNAIAGAADTIMVLKRPRKETIGTLTITGRDIIEDGEFALNFDRETAKWHLLGPAATVKAETEQQKIYDLLFASSEAMKPKDIGAELNISANTVSSALRRLKKRGAVVKIKHGLWGVSDRLYD